MRRKTFKYALVVVDVASRYKDAEPLTSKESSEVAKSFEKIYSRKLKWPVRIIIDPGKEFMGRVTSLMKRHNVVIQRSEAGNHRAQAFVERANRTLSERLFSFQYGKEMSSDDNERSREWVERLPAVLKSMNNEVTRLSGKEPLEVLKLKDISINAPKYNRPVGFDEVRLSPFAKVRYLFAPVVDVASRYKDAEPLTSKESSEVAKSFEKIYSRKLKWPVRIIIDPGKEFMGRVTSLMKRHNVVIQRSEAGNHRAQAFVERANRTLSERLFSFQYGKEMSSDDNERSREWVERLPAVLKSMNNEVTRLSGKEPLEVLKSKDISINAPKYNRPVGFDEVRLSPFAKVRYLFAPGEYEGGEKRRATDPVWSLEIF